MCWSPMDSRKLLSTQEPGELKATQFKIIFLLLFELIQLNHQTEFHLFIYTVIFNFLGMGVWLGVEGGLSTCKLVQTCH